MVCGQRTAIGARPEPGAQPSVLLPFRHLSPCYPGPRFLPPPTAPPDPFRASLLPLEPLGANSSPSPSFLESSALPRRNWGCSHMPRSGSRPVPEAQLHGVAHPKGQLCCPRVFANAIREADSRQDIDRLSDSASEATVGQDLHASPRTRPLRASLRLCKSSFLPISRCRSRPDRREAFWTAEGWPAGRRAGCLEQRNMRRAVSVPRLQLVPDVAVRRQDAVHHLHQLTSTSLWR